MIDEKLTSFNKALDVLKDRANTREKKWHDSLECLESNVCISLMAWYLALPVILNDSKLKHCCDKSNSEWTDEMKLSHTRVNQ